MILRRLKLSSQYVFAHEEIKQFEDIKNKLAQCDNSLRNAKTNYPFEWISKNAIFAITLPAFDNIDNWENVTSEFEEWYYSIAVEVFSEKLDQHLELHPIKDIVKFRSKGSMHHYFGVNFESFLLKLNEYGVSFSGTSTQKSNKFWKAINEGLITDEQAQTALRKALLPPAPKEAFPQKIYGNLITPVIRPCFINFKETLRRCEGISELLEQLFISERIRYSKVDKEELSNKLKDIIVLRGKSYGANKDVSLSTFVAPALHALLVFLFKKGLITVPTVDNQNILLRLDSIKHIHKNIIAIYNKKQRLSSTSLGQFETESFNNPFAEDIIQELNHKERKNKINSNDLASSASNRTNDVVKYNELPDDCSILAVYISNTEAACSYRAYDNTDEEYETLFNRTDKIVVLPSALYTHNLRPILHDFAKWVSTNNYDEIVPLAFLDIEKIASNNKNLYCIIENVAANSEETAQENIEDLLFVNNKEFTIDKDQCLAIGDLLLIFFWLQGFILMPSYKKTFNFFAPLNNQISGIKEIFKNNRDMLIRDYLENKPHYFNLLKRGLLRAITASNPISNIDAINEGQLELIYKYGYSHGSARIQSTFRKGVRGFVKCLADEDKKHRLNANRLRLWSINKRLSIASEDIWLPWKEVGLSLWHEWLHVLTEKSERIKSRASRTHINNSLLSFLQNYSKTTGEPIPESPFGVTPRMIISDANTIPDFKSYIENLSIQSKGGVFSSAKHIFDTLEEYFPSQWTEAKFIHPFPKRLPFQSGKRNTTHRRPIESLHLDAIKEVLLSPDENGVPTFGWVMNEYCSLNNPQIQSNYKRDILFTNEGTVWWPGTAVNLAFLLEVPVRGIQARWLDEGCLDDELFSLEKNEYIPNSNKVLIRYPDGKSHNGKYKNFNGKSGVIQQRPISFMDSSEGTQRGPSFFINTNKTSMENDKFNQGYFIPWPNEEGMDLPYWLISYMMRFNQKYDPTPKPINFAYEGERNRAKTSRFIYSFSNDAEKLNQYPFIAPLFRDLTRDSRYTRSPNTIVFDKDGNELVPPVSRLKIANLLNAVAKEAEKRLLSEGYPASLASMTDKEGKIIYDIHTLRVTGVSRLMALGVPIEVVRDVVGHAASVMTYYYSVLDQLEVMKKLREGLSIDTDHFPVTELTKESIDSNYFPNVHADPSATIQYGGWVERNGGICPSGICDEGGPAIFDDDGNTRGFTPVPGGQYRCGNCRLWMSGPKYIPQQAHFIDLLMNEIVDIHEDRLNAYESKIETDTEIANKKSKNQEIPQSFYAKSSGLDAKITQLTEKLSYLWVEWRNRYHMLEASIASLDKDKEQLEKGELVLFTGQDPSSWKIQRHVGSKFGLRREIANSIVYHMPITHEVSHALNDLERHMTKLQLYMSSNEGLPVSISQILDDDLRNRAIAMHAQHLYLIMQKEVGDADQRIDRILAELQKSLPNIEDQEYSALEQWHKATSESLKDTLELPDCTSKAVLIPLQTKLIDGSSNDE